MESQAGGRKNSLQNIQITEGVIDGKSQKVGDLKLGEQGGGSRPS